MTADPILTPQRTTVIARYPGREQSYWLIFQCGHWLQWMSRLAPKVGADIGCPQCDRSLTPADLLREEK